MAKRLLAGVVATVLAAGTAGCEQVGEALGTHTDRYSTACAVLVDGSGSAAPAPEGFDAEVKLDSALPDFLADLECRTLAFAPITGASEGSRCREESLDLDPDADATREREEVRVAQRAVAQGVAHRLLECAQEADPGSDVLGALSRVSTAAPGDGEPFHILAVSDFIQRDAGFQLAEANLTTAESRAAIIDELAAQDRLPELADATVHVVGFGMRYSEQPDAYADFRAFWEELLEGRGHADVDDTYRS